MSSRAGSLATWSKLLQFVAIAQRAAAATILSICCQLYLDIANCRCLDLLQSVRFSEKSSYHKSVLKFYLKGKSLHAWGFGCAPSSELLEICSILGCILTTRNVMSQAHSLACRCWCDSISARSQASTTKVSRLCIFTQGGYDLLSNIVEMSLIFSCSKSLGSFWMMQDFFSFVSISPTATLCSIDW